MSCQHTGQATIPQGPLTAQGPTNPKKIAEPDDGTAPISVGADEGSGEAGLIVPVAPRTIVQDDDRPVSKPRGGGRKPTASNSEGRWEPEIVSLHRQAAARRPTSQAPDTSARLLDAWHGSYSGAFTVSQLASQPRLAEAAIEAVLPAGDDRQEVLETRVPPWRWICSLIITAPDGSQWLGTGWLASPRLIITAGHCVFIHGRGGWADQIDIYPERNGPLIPYHLSSTDLRSTEGWVDRQSPDSDYGAIILPEPTAGLGYFGYGVLGDDELDGQLINVYGYPADKDPGTLWGQDRTLEQVLPRKLVYDISTFGGQSGCPVFYKQAGRRYAVGVHNYGDITGNTATRITAEVFDNIEAWREESR